MRHVRLAAPALVILAVAALTASARAQGTLSTQGFGYPAGEISVRSDAMGSAGAELDPLSTLNPAALVGWGRGGLYAQFSPEYRSVRSPTGNDKTSTFRFPVVMGAIGIGSRAIAAISATSFLDRTWETQRSGYDHTGGGSDSTRFTETTRSSGSIEDIRLGLGYQLTRRIQVGVAGHLLTGENQLRRVRTFSDTTFLSFTELGSLSYSGAAASVGVEANVGGGLTVAGSGRFGGTLRAYQSDTLLSRASMPTRYGFGAAYSGIPGLTLAARAEWDGWSSLQQLGAPGLRAFDGWDWGVGAEVRGPALFGGNELPVRIGFRRRVLPFAASGQEVHEKDLTAGIGIPFARGRSRIDLSVQRAIRNASLDVNERAWILGFGLLVHP